MRMLISGFSPAKELGTRANQKFPDTIGYMWTAVNDSNTLRVDAKIFATAKKYLRKKKFLDTCGHGLRVPNLMLFF